MKNLIMIIILIMIFEIAAFSQAINNPVMCETKIGLTEEGFDESIVIGKITFDELPEYMKETKVIFEYYPFFDSDSGLVFKYNRPFDGSLLMREYIKIIDEPVTKGDVIQFEFHITPMKIGLIPFSFIVLENCSFPEAFKEKRHLMIGGQMKADFLLGPDGKTYGIASKACKWENATGLGLYPELFENGQRFYVWPKPILSEYNPGNAISQSEMMESYHYNFAMEINVKPEYGDSALIRFNCNVSPYHNFSDGIGFQIKHSEEIEIIDVSPNIIGSVDSSQTYEFTAKSSLPKSGLSKIMLGFYTPNPEFESLRNSIIAKRRLKIGNYLSLIIGVDENGRIMFINDEKSFSNFKRLGDRAGSVDVVDDRYGKVLQMKKTGDVKVTNAAGFDELIRGKKINNNRRIRNR